MEVLKFIVVTFGVCLIIFFGVVFPIDAILDLIEKIKLAKPKKKWAMEQERAKRCRNMKLGFCRNCPNKANGTNYFGRPCIYNSEWLCEGPAAPEHPITITVTRAKDMVEVTRCKDCISWEGNYCHILKKPIYNPDWFCCSGMKKKRGK